MKKLLILLLFTGCTTLNHIPTESTFYGFDFRKYAEGDFLITPEMYQGNYMTMEIVNYEIYPEANYMPTGVQRITMSENIPSAYKWFIKPIDQEWAIDSMYVYCRQMGADALVNFKIESIDKSYPNANNPITITGVKISGYAIKRLD